MTFNRDLYKCDRLVVMITVDSGWSTVYSTSLEYPNSKVETIVVAALAAPAVHVHACIEHLY